MSFESFMAKRYLKVRHQRRFVSLITVLAAFGVAVGVMVLVVVIAVMSGFQSELKTVFWELKLICWLCAIADGSKTIDLLNTKLIK